VDNDEKYYVWYHYTMLKDVVPFDRVWLKMHGASRSAQAITSFIHFLERRLGAAFVYDQARIGYEPLELVPLIELAETLRTHGVIRSYKRTANLSDEPRMASWHAEYSLGNAKYENSGGSSLSDDSLALTKTIAEAIERHAWFTYENFTPLISATVVEMKEKGEFLHPESFAGYSESVRKENLRLQFKPTDSFRWVKGYSWIQEKPVWVPAQIVSGAAKLRSFSLSSGEPVIRASITTGIATHPLRIHALLSGALEVIERDAYMITWLNQLSPPSMDLAELSLQSESLARLLAHCRRYRLEPHALRLPTDAPAYAVCIMLEDTTGTLPRFSVGLNAHKNPVEAVEGAVLEALRMHQSARRQKLSPQNNWDPATKAADITHYNRLVYWAEAGRADKLTFLIQGAVQPLKKEVWETDTNEEHFARIVSWCREKNYELTSVDFNTAPANVPNWHIEFVVIPELQPIYFNEKLPQTGGKRLQDIPRQFGYKPRTPYIDEPHPFV